MNGICMALLRLHSYFFCFCWILSTFQVLVVLETKLSPQTEETHSHQYYFLKYLVFAELKFDPLWDIFYRWGYRTILYPQRSISSIFILKIRIRRSFCYSKLRWLQAKFSYIFKLNQLFQVYWLQIHNITYVQLVYPLIIFLFAGPMNIPNIW